MSGGDPHRPLVFLHVGAMKTGTTYLQSLLHANREHLADAGYLRPGGSFAAHSPAVRDALGMAADEQERARLAGRWDRLRARVLRHEGPAAVLSNEFLSFAGPRQAADIARSLSPAEVRVVLTVRDVHAVLPSQWQTSVRNRGTASWEEFTDVVLSGDRSSPTGRSVRRALSIPRILRNWGAAVPDHPVEVVTVPRPGSEPGLLWRRFASVLGVDPDVCREGPTRSNPSMGLAAADLMRRVNARVPDLHPVAYRATVRSALGHHLAEGYRSERPPPLTPELARFAAGWNRRIRRAVRAHGARVTGDLDDLPVRPPGPPGGGTPAVDPPAEQTVEVATYAVRGMHDVVAARRRVLREHGLTPPGPAPATPDRLPRWAPDEAGVEAALDHLVQVVRTAVDLQEQISALR